MIRSFPPFPVSSLFSRFRNRAIFIRTIARNVKLICINRDDKKITMAQYYISYDYEVILINYEKK